MKAYQKSGALWRQGRVGSSARKMRLRKVRIIIDLGNLQRWSLNYPMPAYRLVS
jgi:hypothetical protein